MSFSHLELGILMDTHGKKSGRRLIYRSRIQEEGEGWKYTLWSIHM